MHHVSIYSASIAQTAYTDVAAKSDEIINIVNSHFQVFDNLFLLGACALGTTLTRSYLASATLRQVNPPFLFPVRRGTAPSSLGPFIPMIDAPTKIPVGEELAWYAYQDSAGAEVETLVMLLGKDIAPVPAGDIVRARFTSSTAAVAYTWTNLSYALDNSLPNGLYAMVGSRLESTTGIAHRWIIPNQFYRPGALSCQAVTDIEQPMFVNHRLGEWGRFSNYNPPVLQGFCVTTDNSHVGYLELVKVG